MPEPIRLTDCPSCGLPAEVTHLDHLPSTHGLVTQARVWCITREHRYTMLTEQLAPIQEF